MNVFALIAEDLRTQREGLLSQGFWALFVYRLSHCRLGFQNGLVRKPWAILNMLTQKWIEMTCGITLPESARIGRRLRIEHYGAIIVHGNSVIGDDCLIRQGVTIGNKGAPNAHSAPHLGDRVEIGAGAKLIGGIKIGDGAKIGANAVVTKDVPRGYLALGIPATIRPPREPYVD